MFSIRVLLVWCEKPPQVWCENPPHLQVSLAVQQERVQAHPAVQHAVPVQLLERKHDPGRVELRGRLADVIREERDERPREARLEDHSDGERVGRPAEEARDEDRRREGEHERALAQDLRLALARGHAGLREALQREDVAWKKSGGRVRLGG